MTPKVLFVDDDDANLVVCQAICAERFATLVARSATEALQHLQDSEIGVVLADQRMPGMSGVDLLERVRREYPDTIRILITAYSELPAAIDAINRGQVRRYLRKPWEPDELLAEIHDALQVYEMTRKLSAIEHRLRQSERMYALGVVAASIGHELKNPVSWIAANVDHSESLLDELRATDDATVRERLEEIRDCLQDARTGVQRVAEIIRSIELPSRPPQSERGAVDLAEVVKLTLRLVSGELRRCATLLHEDLPEALVLGSSTQISQVILNLIVNALQAFPPGRPNAENLVCVRVKPAGASVVVQIADNGPGVPEDHLERIFEPFFTTKPGVGTGLGLAISRKIIEDLGGRFEVQRDPELGGALFQVTLRAYTG